MSHCSICKWRTRICKNVHFELQYIETVLYWRSHYHRTGTLWTLPGFPGLPQRLGRHQIFWAWPPSERKSEGANHCNECPHIPLVPLGPLQRGFLSVHFALHWHTFYEDAWESRVPAWAEHITAHSLRSSRVSSFPAFFACFSRPGCLFALVIAPYELEVLVRVYAS